MFVCERLFKESFYQLFDISQREPGLVSENPVETVPAKHTTIGEIQVGFVVGHIDTLWKDYSWAYMLQR